MPNKNLLNQKRNTVRIGNNVILSKINLEIIKGDFIYIAGGNGAGKTTFVREIIGLGQTERWLNEKIGYVSQTSAVDRNFPITVSEFLNLAEVSNKDDVLREPQDDIFIIGNLETKLISDLSGGEFQKVLINRAVAINPEILILDEPLNNLDPDSQQVLLTKLHKLNDKGMTIIMITHDHNIINTKNHKVFLAEKGTIREVKSLNELHGELEC